MHYLWAHTFPLPSRDIGLSSWCPSHWKWVLLSSLSWMKPLSRLSLAEQAGLGGRCEAASPFREEAALAGTRWVLWSQAHGVKKKDAAIVKQKRPAQFLASGSTCQRDRRCFLAAPAGLCQVGNQCYNPSGHPLGLADAERALLVLAQGRSWPRCLHSGSAVPSGQGRCLVWGQDSPLESWKCYTSQKGPSAIKRVYL